jgi:hypothetical protein
MKHHEEVAMEPSDARAEVIRGYEASADQLEMAARHLRVAANHYRNGDVPRGCAHGFAAIGHPLNGQKLIEANAILHASRSSIET